MSEKKILVDVQELRTYFPIQGGVVRKTIGHVHAVEDVSFQIREQETFGLVGESGCGKSTTGRTLLRLIQPTAGRVLFDGVDLSALSKEEMRKKRRDMQLVFQDPYASLNPRMTVRRLLEEPLVTHFTLTQGELEEKVSWIAQAVGLAPEQLERYPHQFSGGQRQRISIARALVTKPRFVVADEPVSALDVSIQAQILNLMQDLQQAQELTYLFITHDLSVVKHVSDHILVMYLGCMVEKCPAKELFHHQYHPYTKGLISAIPIPNIHRRQEPVLMKGELSSPIDPKPGCRFANRCPYAQEVCSTTTPQLVQVRENHLVACHFVKEINGL